MTIIFDEIYLTGAAIKTELMAWRTGADKRALRINAGAACADQLVGVRGGAAAAAAAAPVCPG